MFSVSVMVGLSEAVITVANNNSFFLLLNFDGTEESVGPAVTNLHLVPDPHYLSVER